MCSRATAAISGDSSMPTTSPCAPTLSRGKPQHSPRSAPGVDDHLPGANRRCLHDRLAVGAGMRWSLRPPPVTGPPYRWERAALRQTPDLAQSRIRADLPVLGIERVAIGHASRLADHAFQVLRNMASFAETCSRNMGCRSIDGEYLLAGTSRPSASAIART